MICPDYDLCEKCEAHPIPYHPPAHHLLKMRTSAVPLPYRPVPPISVPFQPVPPSPTREATAVVTIPSSPPPKIVQVSDGSVVPESNASVDESASFATPTVKPVEVPPTDVPAVDFLEKESNIPGTFEPDEEPFFRNLDLEQNLGDLNFERDFAQWFNPVPEAKLDSAVTPQPAIAESSTIADPEPVIEPLATSSSPVVSEKVVQPVLTPVPEPSLRATFISDNNISDGHLLPPGAEFVKSWKMLNDGVRDWPETTQLIFVAGDKLVNDENTMVKVGKVVAGEEIDIWTGDMKVCLLPVKSMVCCLCFIGP
jgi:next to BRCA1 gene 1 protein